MPKRKLVSCLGALHPVSKAYQKFIEQNDVFSRKTIRKNVPLLVKGRNGAELHFVDDGAFKMYLVNENNEEQIIDFFAEGAFILVPEKFIDVNQDRPVYIVAMENSQLLSAPIGTMNELVPEYPEIKAHVAGIKASLTSRQLKHISILFLPPCERFGVFVREFNDISARLSPANTYRFLGISLKTLQRSKKAFRLISRSKK
jgi:CRP-like cAMP-binding protein